MLMAWWSPWPWMPKGGQPFLNCTMAFRSSFHASSVLIKQPGHFVWTLRDGAKEQTRGGDTLPLREAYGCPVPLSLFIVLRSKTCLMNPVRHGNDLVLVAAVAGLKRLETTSALAFHRPSRCDPGYDGCRKLPWSPNYPSASPRFFGRSIGKSN
jgi:hypothetical protein